MRIFSLPNILLLAVMLLANGQVMDRLPEPLRQLMGRGTAIAMSDKFDMNAILTNVAADREQALAMQKQIEHQVSYQPYDFSEGRSDMQVKQRPFPKEQLEQAVGNNEIPPYMREQVKAIFSMVMKNHAAAHDIK